jgi:dGTPase
MTPEGEVVSWADRIAYVCHDFEDAAATGIVTFDQLPEQVRTNCGTARSQQLRSFISSMIAATAATGRIGMQPRQADALAEFRRFNYDNIYMRDASRNQAKSVIDLLQALVEHYASHPHLILADSDQDASLTHHIAPAHSAEALHSAVAYVGGMTDRFACRQGTALLGWDASRLPQGIDTN